MADTMRSKVEEWLRTIGSTPQELEDTQAEWHLEFDYPSKSEHRMHVMRPRSNPAAVVVGAATNVSHEHLEAFGNLDDDAKEEFLWEFRRTVNQPEVDFRLDGVSEQLDCPTRFQISVTRYDDGLTLDSLAQSIGAVFKVWLGAIWVIQQQLAGNGDSFGGRFDFKRLGF